MTKMILSLSLLIYGLGAYAGGTGVGGGAGCPQSDGSVITLLECGAYVSPSQITSPPVPPPQQLIDGQSETPEYLDELVNYIQTYPWLNEDARTRLIHALRVTFTRKYFSVSEAPDLPSKVVDRIKEEFSRYTKLDPSQLILYGVTDVRATLSHMDNGQAQITYLLPAFRQLRTKEEKMTALFHEALWVALGEKATYETVIAAEVAFETAYQRPDDTEAAINLVNAVSQTADNYFNTNPEYLGSIFDDPHLAQLYLKRDLETGVLEKFVNKDKNGHMTITNYQLLGSDTIACFRHSDDHCDIRFANYADSLRRTYANSLFVGRLALSKNQTSLTQTLCTLMGLPSTAGGNAFYMCPSRGIYRRGIGGLVWGAEFPWGWDKSEEKKFAAAIAVMKQVFEFKKYDSDHWEQIPTEKEIPLRLSIDPKDSSPILPAGGSR